MKSLKPALLTFGLLTLITGVAFWPRPSAVSYATIPSGAGNQGPTSAALKQTIAERAAALRTAHALSADAAVPEELLQASGSGIDPHLSPQAAEFQLDRVCRERGFDGRRRAEVAKLIAELTEPPFARTLGAWRINVLLLNVRLDAVK